MITKDEVAKIKAKLTGEIYGSVYITVPYEIQSNALNDYNNNIRAAIERSLINVFDKLLDELTYTDEKFENDIGLKS